MGKLDKGFVEATTAHWRVADTAKDWNMMFPPASAQGHNGASRLPK
jgi:hypothetical protein